jgi:hypothetical protein
MELCSKKITLDDNHKLNRWKTTVWASLSTDLKDFAG